MIDKDYYIDLLEEAIELESGPLDKIRKVLLEGKNYKKCEWCDSIVHYDQINSSSVCEDCQGDA